MALILVFFSCCSNTTTSDSPITSNSQKPIEPGFRIDTTRKDSNERILIPEEWNPELIYATWKISSFITSYDLELTPCDTFQEITFTRNKSGRQSGNDHFAMEIAFNDENCSAINRKTVWYFNPNMEREVILINLPIGGQFVMGSFKVLGLNSKSMTLTKDFYHIEFTAK